MAPNKEISRENQKGQASGNKIACCPIRNSLPLRLLLSCLLFFQMAWAAAQPVEQPPQPPPPVTPPSAVPPPAGLPLPGATSGETPHQPSLPPTGYEPAPAPSVTVTGGVDVPVAGDQLRLDADSWRVDFEEGEAVTVTARGNVKATFRDFSVTSAAAFADLRTKTATFSDQVTLKIKGQDVVGTHLSINLETREWSFESAKSELRPELFPQQIRAPFFLSGETITGRADEIARVTEGGFTTCNLDDPHYFIDSETATVWPGRKLVARDASFFALGRRIFKIPRIAVPLRELMDRQNLIPKFGQTAEEGFFLKGAYSFAATLNNSGNVKFDLMSKKGIGIGLDDTYNLGRGSGNLHLYQLSDRNRNLNTLTGRFTHEHRLGTITANLTSDYRANSFQYSPASTSLGNEIRLARSRTGASTNLGVRRTTDRGFGSFSNLTSSLQHRQTFGERSSAAISFDYFRSVSPLVIEGATTDAANAQLVSRFDYSQRGNWYDWNFRINKINDLSDEAFIRQAGTRFAGVERLPELDLSTTSDRLKRTLPFGLPARLNLAFGQYREDLGRVETERTVLDLDVPSQTYKIADRLTLNAGAGFRQYIYGNNTAQYSIDAAANLTRKIGDKSSAALNYRYLRPHGFTPFRFDFIGRYNILTGRLNLQETERLRLSLATGYNFGQKDFKWQDLTTRVSYAPSDRYLLYAATGYDINRSQWRALVNQIRVRLPNDFKLDIGSRYDIERSKFATIKTQLDTPIGEKWRLRALTGYNGFTKDFDYRHFQIVRDLHCWELSIGWVDQRGFWQERGLRLNLRIKAIPFFDSFGVGQFGQSLDTSVGEIL
ncbi:MAG: hypothetical protein HYX78_11235 [Armatimonadetes bacterium]|nr:hypothetical protein [Armatimonadota bacterium]